MEKETMIKYAPIAMVVIGLIVQWHIFVTPEQLEIKHREILKDVSIQYVPKDQYNTQVAELKEQMNNVQEKLDKIYDIVSRG